MKVALLHYSGPPTVGGVEQTLYYHALALSDYGHQVTLIIGEGEPFDERIRVIRIDQLYSKHPKVLAVKRDLDRGSVGQPYFKLKGELRTILRPIFAEQVSIIIHNAITLHKNLALTAALWDLHQQLGSLQWIGWHHDFAWDRPGYREELHDGEPWDLLREPWPGMVQVVVSQAQRERLSRLYGIPPDEIYVIPPGVDPAVTGRWTDQMRSLAATLALLTADAVFLLPTRITRRKNIEFAIRVLHAVMQQSELDVRLVITGPPGPHNPANVAYLQELLQLTAELRLQNAVHFLCLLNEDGLQVIDDPTMANLYSFSDALLFPSRDEGFGIPILEAGLSRLPVYCSEIPPFRESGQSQVTFFPLDAMPQEVAEKIVADLFTDPAFQLRQRVLKRYTWMYIVKNEIIPLLEKSQNPAG